MSEKIVDALGDNFLNQDLRQGEIESLAREIESGWIAPIRKGSGKLHDVWACDLAARRLGVTLGL